MTAEHERRGALEAIDRIVNRGGDPAAVRRDVVRVLSSLYPLVAIDLDHSGPGASPQGVSAFAIVLGGAHLGHLVVASANLSDEPFLERVAMLVSPYCRPSAP